MKTVGEILKSARIKKKKTLKEIHKITKIPEKTLKAIEENKFSSLPSATFIKGFIKKYAQAVDLDSQKLIAIFRRDWKKEEKNKILPYQEELINKNSFWTPRTLFILGIGTFLILFFGYFGFQLERYLSPPKLVIEEPAEEISFTEEKIVEIKGKVNKEATIYINNQLVSTDEKGFFVWREDLLEKENLIEIKAVDRNGRETKVVRKIKLVDKTF